MAKCYDILSEKEKQIGKDLEGARDGCDKIAINLISVVAIESDAGKFLKNSFEIKKSILFIANLKAISKSKKHQLKKNKNR